MSTTETGRRNAPADATPTPDHAYDLVVRARRVLGPDGFAPCEVGVVDGVVVAVEPLGSDLTGLAVVELADDEVLLPGLVDTHVHVNEPGRTEWEGFASATRAAAAGGVTTIVDMPLNSVPPTTDVGALRVKQAAAQGECSVDVGFWGGAVPGNLSDLQPLHDAGVFGFKCFTVDSGVEEFGHLSPPEVEAAMVELARYDGLLIVHAEDPGAIASAPPPHGVHYSDFLRSRPREAENSAIDQVIASARRTGARTHILHLSSSDALPAVAQARAEGVRLTVETCPHYLALVAEDVPDGATMFKCCPPIREEANRELLWEALLDGTIDIVVSDHSPSSPHLKHLDTGDFGTAWGGVSSLHLGLSVVWTEARRRGIPLERVVEWMSSGPAAIAGLRRKGAIEVGRDADLVVFAPEDPFTVEPGRLHHKHAITPYAGSTLSGVVRRTLLRGADVTDEPRGALLTRGDA